MQQYYTGTGQEKTRSPHCTALALRHSHNPPPTSALPPLLQAPQGPAESTGYRLQCEGKLKLPTLLRLRKYFQDYFLASHDRFIKIVMFQKFRPTLFLIKIGENSVKAAAHLHLFQIFMLMQIDEFPPVLGTY